MERELLEVAADIVEEWATQGVVSTDLYARGTLLGLNVDVLIEQAEDLYELSNEQLEATLNPD